MWQARIIIAPACIARRLARRTHCTNCAHSIVVECWPLLPGGGVSESPSESSSAILRWKSPVVRLTESSCTSRPRLTCAATSTHGLHDVTRPPAHVWTTRRLGDTGRATGTGVHRDPLACASRPGSPSLSW
jgi:hypothetical protein